LLHGRPIALAAAGAIVSLAPGAASAATTFTSSWSASSGVLPTQVCPPFAESNNGGTVSLAGGAMTLSTPTITTVGTGKTIVFSQSGSQVSIPSTLVIKATVKVDSSATDPPNEPDRDAASIAFSTDAGGDGNVLYIGIDPSTGLGRIYINSATGVRGAVATLDTKAFHTYTITETGGAVDVYVDAGSTPTLTGSIYHSTTDFPPTPSVSFADGGLYAYGQSDWKSFANNAAVAGCGHAGYVWANQPTAASYTPSLPYQYNTTGATNTISRLGTGSYDVFFHGIGTAGGTVDVTSYNNQGLCQDAGWSQSGTTEVVHVLCFGSNSLTAADEEFTAAFTRPASLAGGQLAYLWDDSPTAASSTPPASYQYNSKGGLGTVTRSGTGRYVVTFPNQGVPAGGTVKVTAYGAQQAICLTSGWSESGTVEHVDVLCDHQSTTGTFPVDTDFAVTFAAGTNMLGASALHGAYVSSDPSGHVIGPYNSTGQPITITALTFNGRFFPWKVTLKGQGAFGGGDIQVSPDWSTGALCNAGGWSKSGSDLVATINCDSDVPFTMQWVSN
jgi:hypothetical protein